MTFSGWVEGTGKVVDGAGVVVMVAGVAGALVSYAWRSRLRPPVRERYRQLRGSVGRAILLGLELLVAGDIIRTVGVRPTFTTVGVLAVIVVIRSFLSMTLELEITGRWPWEKRTDVAPGAAPETTEGASSTIA